jgi:hypothetical protein
MRRSLVSACCALLLLASGGQAALLFDNADDNVTTTNVTGFPTGYPLTITAILTVGSLNSSIVLCGAGGSSGYLFSVDVDGHLMFGNIAPFNFLSSTGSLSTATPYFVAWAHASATSHRFFAYNYATRSIAFNETSTTDQGALTAPAGVCRLGTNDEGGPAMNGPLTQIAAYSRDLTIQNGDGLLNLATLGPYAGATPSVLYTFNEASGTSVRERRGTGNVGTMTGFPASPWQPIGLPGPVQGGW